MKKRDWQLFRCGRKFKVGLFEDDKPLDGAIEIPKREAERIVSTFNLVPDIDEDDPNYVWYEPERK